MAALRPLFLVLTAGLVLPACKDDPPPGCRLAQEWILAPSSLTSMPAVQLLAAGDAFVLVGMSGNTVRWARLGADGTEGAETSLTLPSHAGDPVFAATGKGVPGDQLLALYLAPKSVEGSPLQLWVIAEDGGGVAAAPQLLFDLPAGADAKSVALAAGPAKGGRRAAVAWGILHIAGMITVQVLGPDAVKVGSALQVAGAPGWSCLAFASSHSDLGVSLLLNPDPGQKFPVWKMQELPESGAGLGSSYELPLNTADVSCPTVSATGPGYVMGWQNRDGSYFVDYASGQTGEINPQIVVGAVHFGGPDRQPALAAIAPMAKEFAFLFDGAEGHQAWRFDALGNHRGSPFHLPATRNRVGPLAAVPRVDSIWATYLDDPISLADAAVSSGEGGLAQSHRYFMKLDCTADLP